MSVLVKTGEANWLRASQAAFVDESALQQLLYNAPEIIEWENHGQVIFTKEASLPGSGYTDLIGVADNGDILLVETKLAKNSEIRRKVIGQVLEYAAFLWGFSYSDFNQLFEDREGKTLADLLAMRKQDLDRDALQQAVIKNLEDGRFHLLIAVDEMNDELEKIIAYVSSRGGGLRLEALAIRVFTQGEIQVLVPQRYGQLNQPPVPPTDTPKRLTVDEVLDKSPESRTRELMKFTLDGWAGLGYILEPGKAGLSCKADINGTVQPLFWVDPSASWGIQPLFRSLEKRGAPPELVQEYRKSVSLLKGFAGSRCLTDKRPPAPFPRLDEKSIGEFLELTNRVVEGWRTSSQIVEKTEV